MMAVRWEERGHGYNWGHVSANLIWHVGVSSPTTWVAMLVDSEKDVLVSESFPNEQAAKGWAEVHELSIPPAPGPTAWERLLADEPF